MEPGCLLELHMEGVDMEHKCPGQQAGQDEVAQLLLDTNEQVNNSASCISTVMDFEFASSDLGPNSDFSIDHSSMFDITEPVIDENEKSDCAYLFRDSNIFDEGPVKQTEELEGLVGGGTFGNKKLNLCKDLGLKLQIIPLNNLQFVSTVQTSEGLHILAVPPGSELYGLPSSSPLLNNILTPPEINASGSNEISNDCLRHPPELETIVKNYEVTSKSKETRVEIGEPDVTTEPNVVVEKVDNTKDFSALNYGGKDERLGKLEPLSNMFSSSFVPLSSEAVTNVSQVPQCDNGNYGCNLETDEAQNTEQKSPKESKIFIDLRKLVPKRKQRMVSLLKNPKTNKLLHFKERLKQNLKGSSKKESDVILTFQVKTADGVKCISNEMLETITVDSDKSVFKFSNKTSHDTDKTKEQFTGSHVEEKVDYMKEKGSQNQRGPQKLQEGPKSKQRRNNDIKVDGYDKNVAKATCYTCEVCLAKFTRKGNFKNHCQVHSTFPNDIKLTSFVQDNKQSNIATCSSIDQIETVNTIDKIDNIDTQIISETEVITMSDVLTNHEYGQSMLDSIQQTSAKHRPLDEGLIDVDSQSSLLEDQANCLNQIDTCPASTLIANTPTVIRCEMCSLTFTTIGNLTRHKLTHMTVPKEGRFQCSVCKRSFLQQCDLRRHQLIHSGEYPHSCTTCGKGFIRQSDLAVHVRFHSREKKYRCDMCTKAYYQSGDLSRHKRQSHGSLCEFSCHRCEMRYTSQRSLNLHMKNKHGQTALTVSA